MTHLIVRAIIEHQGQYLLVKNKGQNFWCLPGGKVEPDEQITAALKRELVEELGIEPAIGKLLYVYQLMQGGDQRLEFFFLINNGGDYQSVDTSSTTHGQLELDAVEFLDIKTQNVLPEFLAAELPALQAANFSGDVQFEHQIA